MMRPSEELQYVEYNSSYELNCKTKTSWPEFRTTNQHAIYTSLYKNRVCILQNFRIFFIA